MKHSVMIAVLLGGFSLSACSTGQQAAIDVGLARAETGIKAKNDREALALKQAPCAIKVGAFNRVLDQEEQDAVMTLCDGSPRLTLEDLRVMARGAALLEGGEE